MLTLGKNTGCTRLTATSETLADVAANLSSYSSLDITLKKNCCTTEYTQSITDLSLYCPDYRVTIPFLTGATSIKTIQFLNIVTSQIITVTINTTLTASCANVAAINALLITAGVASTFSCEQTDGNWIYTITCPLPDAYIIPLKVTYSLSGLPIQESLFSIVGYDTLTSFIGNTLYISLDIFGGADSLFGDGVYTVTIKATKAVGGSFIEESNCFFMDCSTSCNVAIYVKNQTEQEEKIEALMLHYGLTQGSNCGCNCSELCSLWEDLYNKLNSTLNNTSGCGC